MSKITGKTFSKAVRQAYLLNKRMTANIHAQAFILPLGSILFAVHVLILLLGIVYCVVTEKNVTLEIFDTLHFIPDYCTGVWAQFGKITDNTYLKVALFAILLYLIPFVICGVVRLILAIFTRGEKPNLAGTTAEQAKQLYRYVERGPFPNGDLHEAHWLWCKICGIPAIVCFSAIVSYYLCTHIIAGSNDVAIWIYVVLAVIVLLETILIFISYSQLYFPFAAITKRFYTVTGKRDDFLEALKDYWISVDPKAYSEFASKTRNYTPSTSSYSSYSSSSYSGSSLSHAEKSDYINTRFGGEYTPSAILAIEDDPNLTPSEKEDLKAHLRAWGD